MQGVDWQEYSKNIKLEELETFENDLDSYNHGEEVMLKSAQKYIPKTVLLLLTLLLNGLLRRGS